MKINYIIGILIVMIFLLNGCGNNGEVIQDVEDNEEDYFEKFEDQNNTDTAKEENETEETTENKNEEVDVKELINKLGQEEGLWEGEEKEKTSDGGEEEGEESASTEENLITIENFRADPDDITIKVGETVRWHNLMTYKNIILILPQKNNSNKYETKWINDLEEMLYDDSFKYTFNEVGNYKWGSKTKFDKIYGFIEVKE